MTADWLDFRLDDSFLRPFKTADVRWGFASGQGTSFGEFVFLREYSRTKDSGSKERWWEVCRRSIEGMLTYLHQGRGPNAKWRNEWATNIGQQAFISMFNMKWGPPGRGLRNAGTEFVARQGSAALNNCANISTERFIEAVEWMMEAAMVGVGVGFDTRGAGRYTLYQPDSHSPRVEVIPDTRQGWAWSTGELLRSYLTPGQPSVEFDYSKIREKGAPIKGFGGVAAGPLELIRLHQILRRLLGNRHGETLGVRDVVDVMNLAGRCIVSGGVRKMALLAMGDANDTEFRNLKNPAIYPERNHPETGWGWTSNNTVAVTGSADYFELAESAMVNGEPGIGWLEVARNYGRTIDPPDMRDTLVDGPNPCGEIWLRGKDGAGGKGGELCTLADISLPPHHSVFDFLQSVHYAYLYAKGVSQLKTGWDGTDAIIATNHRIGVSIEGVAQFADQRGVDTLKRWLDAGYRHIKWLDRAYSDQLGLGPSIKLTCTKPGGTFPTLYGVTSGVSYQVARSAIRRVRIPVTHPLVPELERAGYGLEPQINDPANSLVVSIPVMGVDSRPADEVSPAEQFELAATAQEYWADNGVSCTIMVPPDMAVDKLAGLYKLYAGRLKSATVLPLIDGGAFKQMPIEAVSPEKVAEMQARVKPLDMSVAYGDAPDAVEQRYCEGDACTL